MRLLLYSLCIFIVLLASALFILGYEGTQIREFLLGVAAIIVIASRMIKSQQEPKEPRMDGEQAEARRSNRLSIIDEAPEAVTDTGDTSESTQSN